MILEIKDYLRMQKQLSKEKESALAQIQLQALLLSGKSIEQNWLKEVLDVMYAALETDPKIFMQDVFFEFELAKRKVKIHKDRIYDELVKMSGMDSEIEEQMHLVNIYRNIVSDLFDPYISLLIASLQLKERSFESFLLANIGQGERNKVEYARARFNRTKLFMGYNPIVRNAVSHTGTDSLIYREKEIVFKNISRGNPPKVDVVVWSNKELYENILSLLDFVNTIDVAVNIFGIDNDWTIEWDEQLKKDFLVHILGKEDRLALQKDFDEIVEKIHISELPLREKLDAFSTFYFLELHQRNLPAKAVRFNNTEKAVLIDVPCSGVILGDDAALLNRLLPLFQYLIVAYPCYKHYYEKFILFETGEETSDKLKVITTANDLNLYAQEEAGLYDLLNDSEIFINQSKMEIIVDFKQLQQLEYKGFGKLFPRKNKE